MICIVPLLYCVVPTGYCILYWLTLHCFDLQWWFLAVNCCLPDDEGPIPHPQIFFPKTAPVDLLLLRLVVNQFPSRFTHVGLANCCRWWLTILRWPKAEFMILTPAASGRFSLFEFGAVTRNADARGLNGI